MVASAVTAAADQASRNAATADASTGSDWTVTAGLESRIIPAWPGASDSRFTLVAFPLIGFRRAGTAPGFSAPLDSFGVNLLDSSQFRLGPAIKLIGDRNPQNYKELYGLAGVDYVAQIGGFAEFWPVPWLRLRGELRQGIGGETGVTSDTFVDAVLPVGQWTLSGGPRLTLQSTAAVSPYFSVTAAESAATAALTPSTGLAPLPAYSASGGLYSYGAGTQLLYRFNPRWEAHTFIEDQRLTGSAADSPLVTQRGSPNQLIYGVGATYSFNVHSWW